MKAQIDLNSISMSKNDPKLTQLEKYDVDANIEEVQSDDETSVFTYKFTALSNPKNVRLSIEGTAQISGDSMERDEILERFVPFTNSFFCSMMIYEAHWILNAVICVGMLHTHRLMNNLD